MLVISRRVGEQFVIGGNVVVVVSEVSRDRVRLGIQAPKDVTVHREEVHLRLKETLEDRRRELRERRFSEGLEGGPNP
jgi:carbon storage regulator